MIEGAKGLISVRVQMVKGFLRLQLVQGSGLKGLNGFRLKTVQGFKCAKCSNGSRLSLIHI